MGLIGCPETSVRNYHYSLRNNAEERSSLLLCDGSLKARKFDLKLQKNLLQCYIWSIALCGAETRTLRIADQIYLESSETWCCSRMQKIILTYRVENEVWRRVKEERNILTKIKRRKASWIDHILRRNCLLKQVSMER